MIWYVRGVAVGVITAPWVGVEVADGREVADSRGVAATAGSSGRVGEQEARQHRQAKVKIN